MTKTYKGKSLRKGGGGKFQGGVDAIMRGSPNMTEKEAEAIMAKQGMMKYGKADMMKMAAKGRKRSKKKRK